jgi:V/A-type H+-transporting ATPase subunit D
MTHPTRTNLLLLKEKARSVAVCIGILKARRLALMRELLAMSAPFLRSRAELRSAYARAVTELALTRGEEGEDFVASLEAVTARELGVEIADRAVMGLRYREVTMAAAPVRGVEERGYDCRATSPHLEEAMRQFEGILAEMLEVAAYESKLKRVGEEIVRLTRRTRVLEERVLPGLSQEIGIIAQYLSERDREAYYRLKRFKELVAG